MKPGMTGHVLATRGATLAGRPCPELVAVFVVADAAEATGTLAAAAGRTLTAVTAARASAALARSLPKNLKVILAPCARICVS
jgi:hypothetical protein